MQMSNLTYNVLTFHAGTVDYKQEVDMRDLDEMKLMCTKPSTSRCEDEFAVRCSDDATKWWSDAYIATESDWFVRVVDRWLITFYPEFKVKTKGTIENDASKQHTTCDTNNIIY